MRTFIFSEPAVPLCPGLLVPLFALLELPVLLELPLAVELPLALELPPAAELPLLLAPVDSGSSLIAFSKLSIN